MTRKSIAQEYFALVIDQNGNMPPMNKDESNAGLVAAGFMDLLLSGAVTAEKKKIAVIKDMPDELGCLASLYAYLKEEPRSTDKLMWDYIISSGARIKQLTAEIGESLLAGYAAENAKGGLFGNKTVYIPQKDYKDELIGIIKAAAEDSGNSPHDMALLFLLQKTKNLNQYFSKYERAAWKNKLKELKKDPQNKRLSDMLDYINDIFMLFYLLFLVLAG